MADQTPPPPQFDPAAPHQQKPKLRPIRGFPAKVGDQTLLGLADARQISDRMVVTAPAVQAILPLMTGEKTLDEIVSAVGRGLTRQNMEMLVAQLDDAALLFGPKFDGLLDKMHREFDSAVNLPPAGTAAFADAIVNQALQRQATDEEKTQQGPHRLRELMDQWIAKALENAESPSFDELPLAVIAPHIDYPRGWLNYAGVWGRMRVVDRPDRVVILGTNHFGMATGIAACDKGYETPLGTSPLAADLAGALRSRLGDTLFAHRYDHEHEHSVELQIPWIQHCLGAGESGAHLPVMGVLVHDPAVNNGEPYDGKGVALMPFVEALRGAIAELPGKTLVVSSADLSHAGPMFGDSTPLVGEGQEPEKFRDKVMQHDREMLELVMQNKPDELVASMAWQQNPTRWCSTGNLVAALLTVRPQRVQILNYVAAADQQGAGMVSHVAAAMW
ncbi:MAG: AmmeMemoRadiSam system protein B [Phycisphaerales bacterium]|nr:AmmeMemoRadiSam system protein B [Phycisphaerales bacterium]